MLLASYLRQCLIQQCVAIVLARGGLGDGLLCGGKLRGELGSVTAIGLPGNIDGDGQDDRDEDLCEF